MVDQGEDRPGRWAAPRHPAGSDAGFDFEAFVGPGAFGVVESDDFGIVDFGVGRRARGPAVAACHASMSIPAHGS